MNKFFVLLAFIGCILFAQEQVPFGSWKIDEGEGLVIRNAQGNGDGKLLGESFEWIDNGPAKALLFKNPSKTEKASYIQLPADNFDATKGFSILVTIKTPDKFTAKSRQYEILNFTNSFGKPLGFRLLVAWNAIWLHLGEGKNIYRLDMPNTKTQIKTGTWYKIAAVFDGAKGAIYLDGVKIIEKEGMVIGKPKLRSFKVGAGGPKYYGFEGIISNLVIYNCPITEKTVLEYCQQ